LLKKLAEESGETATLEVPIDDSMLILDEVMGRHFVGAAANVGTRWPIHATSTGKAIIAFDERGMQRVGKRLVSLTSRTITKRDQLEEQLAEIRERGFAETVDELEEGFSGVAAAIRGSMGQVLGALSVCGPTQRLSKTRRADLGAILCTAAESLRSDF
jgi:DNA-binding IclR family transcriptional regulator